MHSIAGSDNSLRVSILLPVRDGASTLDGCLRSIARQTERRWECVVVDDGSTDETAGCLRRFVDGDARFRSIHQPRTGLVAALNLGLGHCRGRYVARMDADDLMHRERLREQTDLLDERPDLAAVGCHVRCFPRDGLTDGARAYERWLNHIDSASAVQREAFVECPLAHPSLTLRRDCLVRFGYRDAGWPEDYDLVLRLLTAGERLGVVPRRLLAWRDHPARLSRTSPTYALERFTRCKAAFLAAGFLAATDRYDLWGHGATGRSLRAALERNGKHPRRIIEVHPGRLGNRIHGAPVIPPEQLVDATPLPLIVSVAGEGPRAEIRAALTRMGYRETLDYLCAA